MQKEITKSVQQNSLARPLAADVVIPAGSCRLKISGRDCVNFCGDDFLGLSGDRRLQAAAILGLERFGLGVGAPRAAGGYRECHERLERRLSSFRRAEQTVLFNSVTAAYNTFLRGVVGDFDVVLLDAGSSSCILDGSASARAKVACYPHLDLSALERMLASAQGARQKFIVSESLFGQSGEIAPLEDLLELALAFDAQLVIDEGFALGVLGARGSGGCERAELMSKGIITVSWFDRAAGCYGASISSSNAICSLLRGQSHYLFGMVPLPPTLVYAIEAAVDLIEADSTSRTKLATLANRVYTNLLAMGYVLTGNVATPIIQVDLESWTLVELIEKALLERGVLVSWSNAITSAAGAGRTEREAAPHIRLTLSVAHTEEQIVTMLQAFEDIGKRLGLFR